MEGRLGQIQSQKLGQIQKLILSPQMQQALHLLQLPVQELSTAIADELEQNPLLEYSDPLPFREPVNINRREKEDLKGFLESSIAYETSLFDHLCSQARGTFKSDRELQGAEAIIGNLDGDGFLTTPLQEIALLNDFSLQELETLLAEIQTFDPSGVGGRNLRESLLIQLRGLDKNQSLAYRIIDHHFDHLTHNRIPSITKALGCSAEEVCKTIEKEISLLDLHPGTNLSRGHYPLNPNYITIDVTILFNENEPTIVVNNDTIPPLRLNQNYLTMLEDKSLAKETREYIEERIASGKWLLRNISERHRTIYRIAEQILEKQREYLSDPKGNLVPFTMKSVAETLELHESTIVRAVANKYLSCPRGIFPLRSFFTHGYTTDEGKKISSRSVKELLKEMIADEDRSSPLSDETISTKIKACGIPCARRTIAKYRYELGIGNTVQRKSFF